MNVFLWNARARNGHVEATLNHPFPAQVMNNWRTLHGRAGGRASPNRDVVGGTVLREAIYSKAAALHAELQQAETD